MVPWCLVSNKLVTFDAELCSCVCRMDALHYPVLSSHSTPTGTCDSPFSLNASHISAPSFSLSLYWLSQSKDLMLRRAGCASHADLYAVLTANREPKP